MLCRADLKHVDIADSGRVGPKKWYEKMRLLSFGIGESRDGFGLVSAGFEMLVMGRCWEVPLTARLATSLPSRPASHSDP